MALWDAFIGLLVTTLNGLHGFTGNYGLAIILLTIIIRLFLLPLTHTQTRSMRRMQQIQPEVQKLQKKHKKDPQKLNQEMMKLWKQNKVNPLSGCLPILLQMPILIAFFRVLHDFQFVGQAQFIWIPNLANSDPLFILPVLAGITTYWQTKVMSPNPSDPTQKTMLYVMPLFLAWISARFPAGLALYWVVQNLFSVGQQYVLIAMENRVPKEESE